MPTEDQPKEDPVVRLLIEVRSMRVVDTADQARVSLITACIRRLANGLSDSLSVLEEDEYPDEVVVRAKHIIRVALGRKP